MKTVKNFFIGKSAAFEESAVVADEKIDFTLRLRTEIRRQGKSISLSG